MKVNVVDIEDLSLEGYLRYMGIDNPEEYINIDETAIESWEHYDNMMLAYNMYDKHLYNGDAIYIIQDGDFDGMASTSIIYQYTQTLIKGYTHTNNKVKILLHEGKERGLADDIIFTQIVDEKPQLVIIPDAGTADKERVKILSDMGIDVIVFDHHNAKDEDRIEDGVLVSNQYSPNVVNKDGSGTLVTHKFTMMLDEMYGVDWAFRYWDLVGLSIISDAMDVKSEENRFFVKYVLDKDNIRNNFIKEIFSKFIWKEDYTQKDIAFSVVPKFNSVIRTNKENVQEVVKALLGNTATEDTVKMCADCHKEQQTRVAKIVNKLMESVDTSVVKPLYIFADDCIPRSYSGLVCGKMSDMLGAPCIVGVDKDGEIIGSFRGEGITKEELEVMDGVKWCAGHSTSAFGVSLDSAKLDILEEQLSKHPWEGLDSPQIDVLGTYRPNCIPSKLWGEFEANNDLYGKGLEKPKFHIHDIRVAPTNIEWIGRYGTTFKATVNGISYIRFTLPKDEIARIKEMGDFNLEVIGDLSYNEYNGERYKQVMIDEYEISEAKPMSEITFDDFF